MNQLTISFTGTREGMTWEQKLTVARLLVAFKRQHTVLGEHGDCMGADAEFDAICGALQINRVCRPSTSRTRAFTSATIIAEPKHPLDRNGEIMRDGDVVIATPRGPAEERRSGTWHAVRRAREMLKPIYIVWPNGSTTTENVAHISH